MVIWSISPAIWPSMPNAIACPGAGQLMVISHVNFQSVYRVLTKTGITTWSLKSIWIIKAPQKLGFFAWKLLRGILPSSYFLRVGDGSCGVCAPFLRAPCLLLIYNQSQFSNLHAEMIEKKNLRNLASLYAPLLPSCNMAVEVQD